MTSRDNVSRMLFMFLQCSSRQLLFRPGSPSINRRSVLQGLILVIGWSLVRERRNGESPGRSVCFRPRLGVGVVGGA